MVKNRVFLSTLLSMALLLAPVSAVLAVETLQETKTLSPIADSDVWSDGPDWNRGRQHNLRVEENAKEAFVFLMFDLGGVPSTASVGWAKLRLLTTTAAVYEALVGVYYCSDNDWTEDGITYNNMPSFSQTTLDTANVSTASTRYEWNVTETVKSTLQAGDKRLSLVLRADTPGDVEFHSRQNPFSSNYYPELVVQYDAPPQTGIYIPKELIIIAVVGVAAIGLEVIYLHRKRRKTMQDKKRVQDLQAALVKIKQGRDKNVDQFTRELNLKDGV